MTNVSLMKVKRFAECSLWSWKPFQSFWEWPFYAAFNVYLIIYYHMHLLPKMYIMCPGICGLCSKMRMLWQLSSLALNDHTFKVIIPTFLICIYLWVNSILGTIWPFILLKLLQLAHNLIALTCHRGSPLITWILQEEFLRQHNTRCSYQVKKVNYSQCIMFGLIYF